MIDKDKVNDHVDELIDEIQILQNKIDDIKELNRLYAKSYDLLHAKYDTIKQSADEMADELEVWNKYSRAVNDYKKLI